MKTQEEVEKIVVDTCNAYFEAMKFMYSDKIPTDSKKFWTDEFNKLNAKICMLIELGLTTWKEVYTYLG